MADPTPELTILKAIGRQHGYRFEVDHDGTQRMYRPDGTLAVTARCDHKFIDSQACVKCGWRPDGG